MKKEVRKFSMLDKIGYTLGDVGCCCTEQFRSAYLSVFYTLVLQVNPAHSAILFLITKIWDAINDPIIGALVDSKKEKVNLFLGFGLLPYLWQLPVYWALPTSAIGPMVQN